MEIEPAWLADLTGGDDERAEAAVKTLASRGAQVLPALGELLAAPDPEARWWAARGLAEIHDPQAGRLLQGALHDADPEVRRCAALALRQQPASQAIPDLVAALASGDRLLAQLATGALVAAGKEAVPALLEVMQTGPQAARLNAVRALAEIGDPSAIPALFAALDEPSALMEYWANEGLERMGVGMTFFKP